MSRSLPVRERRDYSGRLPSGFGGQDAHSQRCLSVALPLQEPGFLPLWEDTQMEA